MTKTLEELQQRQSELLEKVTSFREDAKAEAHWPSMCTRDYVLWMDELHEVESAIIERKDKQIELLARHINAAAPTHNNGIRPATWDTCTFDFPEECDDCMIEWIAASERETEK